MRFVKVGVAAATIALLLPVALLGAGDFEIHVHLINARTGKPIPRRLVEVVRVGHPQPVAPGTISARPFHWHEKTDGEGVAVFRMPGPPRGFWMSIGMGGGGNYWLQCNNPGFWPGEVVDHGVVPALRCPPWTHVPSWRFRAEPGDVYIFVVHISFWQHLRHCGVPGGCS